MAHETLKIYFTSDLHGYFFPTDYREDEAKDVGLFKIAGCFDKNENTLVIDGGDILQGSAFTQYCSRVCGGFETIADIMNVCGYDYVTLGNHDFNYGQCMLKGYLSRLDAICVCQNVYSDNGDNLYPYSIRELPNGLCVGIVGIVTDYVNLWEKQENLSGITIGDPYSAACQALETLKPLTDINICVYHGGLEQDLETGQILSDSTENIACRICEHLDFDILLTGHQHIPLPGRWYHGTYVIQPSENGMGYAYLEVEKQAEKLIITSGLHAASGRLRAACKTFAEIENKVQSWLDTPVGRLTQPLLPGERVVMAQEGSPLADFLNDVQLHYSGAQLSATSLANDVCGLPKVVRRRDLIAAYPYPNTFVVLEITGAQLRAAIERSAEYLEYNESGKLSVAENFRRPKIEHYNFDFYSGLEYQIDYRNHRQSRVTRLRYDGRDISDSDVFTICVNNYRATGAGGYPMYRDCKICREIRTEMTDLLLDYFDNLNV
ncbi:MAG: bifunctional metallophosphatase/5'-nucleotidase [Oscillospiraceae bacterium]|jgi:2',3'-cyclic-nucleotide 2'-phosphodiesterase/3'-nucleotidase|nr:bifunctional metallophosphatase/5'-nucleotidase [Oscillospiraceae bacterium]